MRGPLRVVAGLAVMAAACRGAAHSRSTMKCPAATPVVALSGDSAAGLCLPTGFTEVRPEVNIGTNGWRRGTPQESTYEWISAHVIDSADAEREWGNPPRPGSLRDQKPGTGADAVTADSVQSHPMSIDGRTVDVETALLSGGFAGLHRKPHVRAVWPLGDGRWAIVQGEASSPQQLEELRALIPSFQLLDGAHR
jgi:hypothetical protein